jgi:hypothetical protein
MYAAFEELENDVKRTLRIPRRGKGKLTCLVPYGDGVVMCAAKAKPPCK